MSEIKRFEHKRSSIRFDVTDLGAVGDGITDDTKAINDAISKAQEVGGGTVVFQKGTYKCMAVRPKSKVTLQGRGWGESVLKGFDDKSDNAVIDGTGYYSQNFPLLEFNVYDLELDGREMNRSRYHYNRKGIGNQWMKNCVFRNVFVHDTPATGIGTDFTINVDFLGCLVKKCGTEGQTGNGIGSNGFGIGVSDITEVVVFSGCQALEIGNNGFTLEAQITQGIGYASITNCYTERCGNAGYSNSGSQGVNIDGCTDSGSKYGVYISANASQPGNQTRISSRCTFTGQRSHGVYSDLAANNHLQIGGCLFDSCTGSAIKVYGSYCSFNDNTFKNCKDTTIIIQPQKGAVGKGYLVANNLLLNGGSTGILIDSTLHAITGLLVKGNIVLDCKGPAIKILCKSGVATGNYSAAVVEGNVFSGGYEPKVEVSGSSTGLFIRNNNGSTQM